MKKLSVYTREINSENYPFGLAKAIHFAVENDTKKSPLNRNYGILFATGEMTKNNTIIPLGIEDPCIYGLPDGSVGIC